MNSFKKLLLFVALGSIVPTVQGMQNRADFIRFLQQTKATFTGIQAQNAKLKALIGEPLRKIDREIVSITSERELFKQLVTWYLVAGGVALLPCIKPLFQHLGTYMQYYWNKLKNAYFCSQKLTQIQNESNGLKQLVRHPKLSGAQLAIIRSTQPFLSQDQAQIEQNHSAANTGNSIRLLIDSHRMQESMAAPIIEFPPTGLMLNRWRLLNLSMFALSGVASLLYINKHMANNLQYDRNRRWVESWVTYIDWWKKHIQEKIAQ